MLTTSSIARHFGCTSKTIGNWVRAGKFPAPSLRSPTGRPLWPESVIQPAAAAFPQVDVADFDEQQPAA